VHVQTEEARTWAREPWYAWMCNSIQPSASGNTVRSQDERPSRKEPIRTRTFEPDQTREISILYAVEGSRTYAKFCGEQDRRQERKLLKLFI